MIADEVAQAEPVRLRHALLRAGAIMKRFLLGIYSREPWLAEFVSSVVCILWGVIALTSTYKFFGAPYMVLLENVDINTIGTYILLSGLLQFVSLVMECRSGRWVSAILVCWFPSIVSVSFFMAPPLTPNVAPYLGWISINLYAIIRHGRRMA